MRNGLLVPGLIMLMVLAVPAAAVTEHPWPIDQVLGRPDAPITVIEYASLTCHHCALFDADQLPRFKKEWIDTGKVRLIVRDYTRNPLDQAASLIAQCSGRYFTFTDTYFHSQKNWMSAAQPLNAIKGIARLGGMSGEQIDQCLGNQGLLAQINARTEDGQRLYDIEGTPTFVVNGKPVKYDGVYEDLVKLLR